MRRAARRPRHGWLALLLLSLARPAAAQDGGNHAAVLLEMPASARASALGGAYAAVGGDEAALFYDPAQLATVRRGAGLSVERYFASATHAALSAATRVGRGTLAVGAQSVRYEGILETIDAEETGRAFSAADVAVTAGYGVDLGALRLPGVTAVRVGAAAKWVRQQVAEATGAAVAADVGLAVGLRGGGTVAVVAQHLGDSLSLADRPRPLPRRVALGGSWPLAVSPRLALLATGELSGVRDEGTRAAGGAEARWLLGRGAGDGARTAAPAIALRVGFRQRTNGAATSPVTLGGGVGARHFLLDYAFQEYGGLGATHRMGIRWAP